MDVIVIAIIIVKGNFIFLIKKPYTKKTLYYLLECITSSYMFFNLFPMFFKSLSSATSYEFDAKLLSLPSKKSLIFLSNSSTSFALYTFLPSLSQPSNIGISLIIASHLHAQASIIGIPSVS